LDSTTLVTVSALSSSLVKALSTALQTRAKDVLSDEAQRIAEKEPESKQRLRELFRSTRQRLSSTWAIGIVMTVVLFVLFISMVVTAVVSGVILDKPMFSIVFGGISFASLLTVVIWKPYEMTFWATITTQRLEMILAVLEQEWAIAGEILDPKERSDQIRKINRATLDEMAKISSKKA
jgi:hypothetical protein